MAQLPSQGDSHYLNKKHDELILSAILSFGDTTMSSRDPQNLGLGLQLGGTAADALSLRALKVRHGDPALVVGLGTRGDSRAVGADNSNLVGGVDLLGATRRLLGALAALATALLLGEEGGDPGVVDEVDGSSESAQEDDIQEDATNTRQFVIRVVFVDAGTYICGSKRLVGFSTTVTVSL
jgi:hypothetical protein